MSGGLRRPLRAPERPHLLALGRLLGTTRRACGVTQQQLGLLAGLSRVQVARIETGASRTRRSTLRRIAAALVVSNPALGPFERLAGDLADAAGPALAEESAYAERIGRRRAARTATAWLADERAAELRTERSLRERERSDYWCWRPAEDRAEMRAEAWAYFTAWRADLEQQRRRVQRLLDEGR